jgi:ankyrin repeat protein
VKKLRFAIAASFLASAFPALAQMNSSPSFEFIKAVESRNGPKALELIRTNPGGILNGRDGAGNTALIIAIARGDSEWTGMLLNKGADANLPGRGGDTPLIVAARTGFTDAASWLLEEGAKVDATNRMGETALIVAVQARALPVVRILLAAGANPDKADSAAGLSARDYAMRDARAKQILQTIETRKPQR